MHAVTVVARRKKNQLYYDRGAKDFREILGVPGFPVMIAIHHKEGQKASGDPPYAGGYVLRRVGAETLRVKHDGNHLG